MENEKVEKVEVLDHICKLCNKEYSSQNSLGNHNRKFHPKKNVAKCSQKDKKMYPNVAIEDHISFCCKNCGKSYKHSQSLTKHKKKCETKIDNLMILKEQQNVYKEEQKVYKEEQKLIKLKLKLQKSTSLDNTTNTNNTNNTNNSTNTNNTNNNYVTYNFNSVENKDRLPYFLDEKAKLNLLLEPYYNYMPKLVELIYCGNYIQFKNVLITNLNSNYFYIYKDDRFVKENKDVVINNLLSNTYYNLEDIYDDIKDKKIEKLKIKNKFKQHNKRFHECYLNEEEEYVSSDDVSYKNFKEYNKEKIVLLLFNNRDKIKERCALFSDKNLTEEEINDMIHKKKCLENDMGYNDGYDNVKVKVKEYENENVKVVDEDENVEDIDYEFWN